MQFISPSSVTVTNGVGTFPASFQYQWTDTTNPKMTIDTVNNRVLHITNWQGSEQQFELLTGGYLFDYSSGTPNVYRIVAAKYASPDGTGNAIDLYLNKAFTGTASNSNFQVISFDLIAFVFTIMVRLESGSCIIRNANDTTTSSLTVANQRITVSPASNIRAYTEPIVMDTTASGVAEASLSK